MINSDRISKLINVNEINVPQVILSYMEFEQEDSVSDEKKMLTRDLKIESVINDVDNDEKIKEVNSDWFNHSNPSSAPVNMDMKIMRQVATINQKLQIKHSVSDYPHDVDIAAQQHNYRGIEDSLYHEVLKSIKKEALLHSRNIEKYKTCNFTDNLIESNVDMGSAIGRKRLIHNTISTSNMIALDGRIGPAQFGISNSMIYELYKEFFGDDKIIGIDWVIDESCGDEVYLGRVNSMDQSSLQLFYRINNCVRNTLMGYEVVTDVDWEIVEVSKKCSNQYIRLAVNFI